MILADTSVWIDFFADKQTAEVDGLERAVRMNELLMGDLILVEILQGAKADKGRQRIETTLSGLRCEILCGPALAPKAAANYRKLRARGVTVRGTIDVIIATWCIENRVALLHNDRDFDVLQRELGLTVF